MHLTVNLHAPLLKTALLAVAMAALTATGCASKASDEACKAACDNVVKIGMEELQTKVGEDPTLKAAGDTGKELVKKQAEAMLGAIRETCMSECSKKGTQQQAECLTSAANSVDFANCKK